MSKTSPIQSVKDAANGREREIMIMVGGANADWFTAAGKPCPHCDGTDRFSWEEKNQSFFCRQCFAEGSARDIVGNVAWLLHGSSSVGNGEIQAAVAKQIADHLGLKQPAAKRKETTGPWRCCKPTQWVEPSMRLWCNLVPPITTTAMRRCHLVAGMYTVGKGVDYSSVMIPGVVLKNQKKPFSLDNLEIQRWECQRYDRTEYVSDWDHDRGDKTKKKSVKMYDTTPIGMCGPWDLLATAEVIVKCEGHTDMLAANSVLPDGWVAISNTNGSKSYAEWIAQACAGKVVYVVHDNDPDGRLGAEKWSKGIGQHAAECYNVRLPGEGTDIRSYLADHTASQLIACLRSNRELIEGDQVADDSSAAGEDIGDESYTERLEVLGFEVLFEDEDGAVEMYSARMHKTRRFKNIGKLSYEDLLQFGGDTFANFVAQPGEKREPHQQSFQQVRRDISLQASGRSKVDSIRGRGIWQSEGKIVVVNSTGLSVWDGKSLQLESRLRRGDSSYALEGGENWFDHDELSRLCIDAMDPDWRIEVIGQVMDHIRQWTFELPEAHRLVTGLIGATLLQTIWPWRPHVCITGATNTGKTALTEWICASSADKTPIMGGLSWSTSNTTAAGLTQSVGTAAKMILIDEWDRHKPSQAEAVLDALRGSSGGGTTARGTAYQKSKSARLRHLVWLSGITDGIEEEADANRFIGIELQEPTPERRKAWKSMDPAVTRELAKKLLAVAIVSATEAQRHQLRLERLGGEKVNARIVRNLSVPQAFLSAMMGETDQDADMSFLRLIAVFESDMEEVRPDGEVFIEAALGHVVDLGRGDKATVSQLLNKVLYERTTAAKEALAREGFEVKNDQDTGELGLFIAGFSIPDRGVSVRRFNTTVGRLSCAVVTRRRIAGKVSRGVFIAQSFLKDKFALEIPLITQF